MHIGEEVDVGIWCRKGVWGMTALVLEVVELMAKNTTARLTGLVEMIWGLANPKLGGARRKVNSHPNPV
jgi:hypothetical protein